jgi:hypothetical protein
MRPSHRENDATLDCHPTVTDRRRDDRKDPARAVDDQWPVRRAFFSAALLAA